MKNKGVKIALIIILSLIIIALINFMIFAIINKDFKVKFSLIGFGNNTEKIFEKEYDLEQLDTINVNVSSANVKIEKADVEKLKVTAYGDKDDIIKDTITDKELFISKGNSKIFIFTMFYWCDEEIIIQIPNDCDMNFEIQTSSGDITAPNLENNIINFISSSGKIECGNINVGNIKTSSGDVVIGNGNEVTLQTSAGNIKAGNFTKLSAEAVSGDVEVENIQDCTIKTSSGKIVAGTANKIQAEATSGDIRINKIEEYCNLSSNSGNIDIETLNIIENSFINAKSGNVKIKSKNDIYVETDTKSGDADIKNNNRKAELVLKITTTSGNIKVE